jgi:hypothetical protein
MSDEKHAYKLGKLPVRKDKRTLQLKSILRTDLLPAIPDVYELDVASSYNIPLNMFANDYWGDCVIAGRANWTQRAECFEQKKCIIISDQEVLTEYWNEGADGTYHPDHGLVMLDSLNTWRRNGWIAGGQKYDIYAFAAIDVADHRELQYAVFLLNGGYIGFSVPQSAINQFNLGQMWTVVSGSPIVGGHCVYVVGYNQTGPICITWARKQQMTWEFWNAYVDESYAIVDNKDSFLATSPVDVFKLNEYLNNLHNNPTKVVRTSLIHPDGSMENMTAPVDSNGKFEVIFTPNVKGEYEVDAQYNTDKASLKISVK